MARPAQRTSAPPTGERRGAGGEPPPARDFLRGLDGACGADVYALCTERLGAEATLGTAFGAPIRARWLQRRAADVAARVDAAARAWVRRTMADDARLHEALCATRPDAGGDEGAVRLEAVEHVFSVAICVHRAA